MRKTVLAVALVSAFAGSAAVHAADAPASPHTFTGNVTLASEYIYRGIGQTNRKAALQGGFDYSHSSGLYLGAWGSNISWLSDAGLGSSSLELDVYGGYKGSITGDLGYDVGVLTYNYPGQGLPTGNADPDTVEVYGALSWKWLSAKYSHSTTSLFGFTKPNGDKTTGSGYLEVNAAYDLGNGWGLQGHVGHQKVDGLSDASYTDYKVGGTKDLGVGVVGLAFWSTDAKACGDAVPVYCNAFNKDLGKGRLLATFTKSL